MLIDLRKGTADMLVTEAELVMRRGRLIEAGGYSYPPSQAPWQEIYRECVGQLSRSGILEGAEKYQRIVHTHGLPRDNQ